MKGLIHVYTGDGKGKTTAALGLALRAAGAGMKVFIGQFLKGMNYSELNAIPLFKDKVILKQYGADHFIMDKPDFEDISCARKGLAEMATILSEGNFDVVIMDEANISVSLGLFSSEELIHVIQNRAEHVEVIVTGRNAPASLIDAADLVTEMKEIKHYYQQGVHARKGIES